MKSTTITKKLFGGKIDFIIYELPKRKVENIIKSVYSEALRLQKIFNFYDQNSELSELNRLRKKEVSKELLEVLKESLKFSKLTKKSYDVSLGKFILSRKKGKELTPTCSHKDIKIKKRLVILKHKDILIDLGSIAKGYITDKLANLLEEKGVKEFLIDSRGDIIVSGEQTHILGIQNPRGKGDICLIELKKQAIATSGDYKQFNKKFNKSHILNQKDSISLTIIAPTLTLADTYATALFTCPSKRQAKLLKRNKKIKALIINSKGEIRTFNNFEDNINNKDF